MKVSVYVAALVHLKRMKISLLAGKQDKQSMLVTVAILKFR
jgi:hypothetical protein